MGVKRSEYENEGRTIVLEPAAPHPWLAKIQISEAFEEYPLTVQVDTHDLNDKTMSKETRALVQARLNKLYGLKALFEPDLEISLGAHQILEVLGKCGSLVGFDASPSSKIRTILSQAEIPHDMQVAVMDELQTIWDRQKG